jgi:HEPN domain-containing protein
MSLKNSRIWILTAWKLSGRRVVNKMDFFNDRSVPPPPPQPSYRIPTSKEKLVECAERLVKCMERLVEYVENK